jgi:hypothetical protein
MFCVDFGTAKKSGFSFFFIGYPVFPAAFIKDAPLSLMCVLAVFVKNQLAINR